MTNRKLDKEKSQLIISIAADKKEWTDIQDKTFKKIHKDLVIKGFRKGNVPMNVAKAHIPSNRVWQDGTEVMLDVLVKKAAKEIKNEDKVLDSPSYTLEKITETEFEVSFTYPVYPEIKLGSYKGLKVPFKKSSVDKKKVDQEIETLREKHALLKPKDGVIVKGDMVKFDFTGSVDGKEFEGGAAKDFILEIGSGKFIPGFEEQMIGLKGGAAKDVKVTFPKDYNEANLQGKEAVFKVKVHEIKVKELPKLDNDFAKEVGNKDVKNMDDLKKYIGDLFQKQDDMQVRNEFVTKVFEKMSAETKIAIPQQIIYKEAQALMKQFGDNLQKQGMDPAKYLQETGMDMKEFSQHFEKQAVDRLRQSFMFAEIARIEKIKPTEKHFDEQYGKIAQLYKKSVEEVKKMLPRDQVQVPIINDLVIDRLLEFNATDAPAAKKAPAAKPAVKKPAPKK